MEPDRLERLVDRALADLPAPRAPGTLHARVMAAVAPQAVGHPWFTWPRAAQAAAMLLVAGLCVVVAAAWPALSGSVVSAVPGPVQSGVGYLESVLDGGAALWRVVELTWSAVVAPIARIALLVIVMLGTACAVCLAALSRVALGGAYR